MYQLKEKDSEIKPHLLYLGNISKDFTINNMKKKAGLKGYVDAFSVDYNIMDITNKKWYNVFIMDLFKKYLLDY